MQQAGREKISANSPGLIGYYFLFMCILSIAGFLEIALRGYGQVLLVKDFIVEFLLTVTGTLFAFTKLPGEFSFACLLATSLLFGASLLLVLLASQRSRWQRVSAWAARYFSALVSDLAGRSGLPTGQGGGKAGRARRWGMAFFRLLILLNAGIAVQIFSTPWWLTCTNSPYIAASLGAVGILAFRYLSRRWPLGRVLLWLGALVLTSSIQVISLVGEYCVADVVPAERLSSETAYDVLVLPDGQTFATFRNAPLQQRINGQWLAVDDVPEEDRLVFDPLRRMIFVDHKYCAVGAPTESIQCTELPKRIGFDDMLLHHAMLSNATGKLYLIHELGMLRVYEMEPPRLDFETWLGLGLYYGHADDKRDRLYCVGSWLDWRIFALDPRTYEILDRRWIGWSNFGSAVDANTGNIWIARLEANEVLVLDPQFEPLAKIGVGFWPRDLKIDQARGLAMVGSYLSGAVTIIDLDTHQVLATVRPLRGTAGKRSMPFFLIRLTGLFVDDRSNLYLADGDGIFRIDAAQIDERVNR